MILYIIEKNYKKAVASISTSNSGKTKAFTSIIDVAGFISPKNSAWAFPTSF